MTAKYEFRNHTLGGVTVHDGAATIPPGGSVEIPRAAVKRYGRETRVVGRPSLTVSGGSVSVASPGAVLDAIEAAGACVVYNTGSTPASIIFRVSLATRK